MNAPSVSIIYTARSFLAFVPVRKTNCRHCRSVTEVIETNYIKHKQNDKGRHQIFLYGGKHMKTRTPISKRILSLVLCLALLVVYLPLSAAAAGESNPHYSKVADANTMNNWTKYFDLDELDTSNVGGVWTDKSVFTNADAFNGKISMIDGNKNFLTALSALAANKEVVGYSTVPTDTVFILDLSNSMSSDSVTDLVDATNAAIANLQSTNKNNRVGVVLYSGRSADRSYDNAVSRLLPIDRYTTTDRNGRYINYSNRTVSVDGDVSGTNPNAVFESKEHIGATYIQAGLWEAYKMFNEVPDSEIVISDDNWQAGEYRMPIVVLMSDGAPTLGASKFDDVENQTYGRNGKGANVGDGNDNGITEGQGFLVQLTASYIKNRIENKYKVHSENGAGRSLFYTLGFNISTSNNLNLVTSGNIAYSVLNPDAMTITDNLWSAYNNPQSNSIQVTVEGPNGDINVTVVKNSYATGKSYVDEYFSASGDGLTNAFDDIVQEIILQSRYYPTHLEGGSPDFSGYVEFTDTLGEYMEVKHINGVLLGDTLFDGHMMASKFSSSAEGGLGTIDAPTELGKEFINAVKTRLKIANTSDADQLVQDAWDAGQLYYEADRNGNVVKWSNYIGWYAKADGTYIKHWNEASNAVAPADAVYTIKSYGFLGETSGSIKNSDMMYMSVQVKTNIETGEQTVSWKIPASLVPIVTYLVTLDGTNVDTATNVNVSVENPESVSPIRLVYETGLRSDLNEFNITRITGESINGSKVTDERHIAADGHTRLFWNNSYDISAESHDDHVTAMAEFTPNKENERFYYTFDSAVHKKTATGYVLVGENEVLDENGEYYHRRYVFKEGESKPVFKYEKISKTSILTAKNNGWQADFKTLDNQKGAWVIPKGTPARELQMYDESKTVNSSNSAHMVFHPYISEQNNIVYIDMNLGNNGLLSVTPATGIKVSKTVDVFEDGTSDTFKFRITAATSGSFDSWITALDETPSGNATKADFTNGVYEVELKKDQTLWISGIPAGTTYTVEEISDNSDYKIKSVSVNGTATGKVATGTVAQYLIDDVHFVNTAIGEGDLVITKQVVDANGNAVDVNNNVKFTAEITLTDASGDAVNGTFSSSAGNITLINGKYTVSLSEGESFIIRGIPEDTNFVVAEQNIPNGFALNTEKSELSGVVGTIGSNRALIVNSYAPTGVDGSDIEVNVVKEITGNRTNWLDGESYTFKLERIDYARATTTVVATATIKHSDTDKSHLFSLAGEIYANTGTYYYRVTEVEGAQGGIAYDTAERRFSVVVADSDMDGDLEIVSVNNAVNTTVSGSWRVATTFNNVYAPTGSATATIDILKEMNGNHALSGYQFALYDADPSVNAQANEIIRSGLTNAAGEATISIGYSAVDAGKTYTYYLAEVNRGQIINNIKYSESVYKVEVTVNDNLDGTISVMTTVSGLVGISTTPTFTNEYVPSSSDFVTISGEKQIVGDRVLNVNEFEFAITAVTAGAPMPSVTTVKNDSNGSFVFEPIEFKDSHKGNTYEYKITEVDTDKIGGFAYDGTVYKVLVTVTDNGDQTITANAVISTAAGTVENIVFKNTYDAKDAEVVLEGTKLLTGKALQNNEFDFELKAVTVGAPMPSSSVAKNDANGRFAFEKITFSKSGTYVYELVEKDGGIANYDYDESVYTVTVTVTDDSQGTLNYDVDFMKDGMDSSEIVFRNGFVPTPIEYDIHVDFGGEKVLNGRTIKANEFEFALINARNGQQIGDTVKNDESGKFSFPKLTLASTGVHHYKIVEIIGDEKGVTYDTSSFHIRLEVVQDDDGVLSIVDKQLHKGVVSKQEVQGVLTEVTTYENITDNGAIKFVNTYKAVATEIVIKGTKTLEGRTLAAEEFSFELYDENNVKLETVKNAADGSFEFAAIGVENAGEYTYTVREVKGSTEGVTYDEAVYTVKVVVTDNLDGTYNVAHTYLKGTEAADGVAFVNVYKTPEFEAPKTGDSSNVQLWLVLMLISGGGLIATVIYSKKEEAEQN